MNSDRRRWTSVAATALLLLFISAWLLAAVAGLRDSVNPISTADFVFAASFLAFPLIGWLLAVRLPHNRLGWIYLTFPIAIGIGIVGQEVAVPAAELGYDALAFVLMELGAWMFILGFWLLLVPGILLFPDDQLPSDRFRWAVIGSALLLLALGLVTLFGSEMTCVIERVQSDESCALTVNNPLQIPGISNTSELAETLLFILLPVMGTISFIGITIRYRRSAAEMREQIKWVAWVAAAGILLLLLTTVMEDVAGVELSEWVGALTFLVITIGLPISIAIAVFKYRLYDIDRIISRTAAYAIVIGLLAGVFVASVTVTQQLLPFESQFGVVVSTLVVAALFNPLRLRVQRAVDRRFNRSRYDAQRVISEFSNRLRDDVDLELMQAALLSAAQETMQPAYLSLWVREQTRESK